jgi:hypothetical protein
MAKNPFVREDFQDLQCPLAEILQNARIRTSRRDIEPSNCKGAALLASEMGQAILNHRQKSNSQTKYRDLIWQGIVQGVSHDVV